MKRMIWVCKAKDIVNRPKVTKEEFGDLKFQEVGWILDCLNKDTLVVRIENGVATAVN